MGDIEWISARWINVRDRIEIQCIDVLHRASILRKEQAYKVYNLYIVYLLPYIFRI